MGASHNNLVLKVHLLLVPSRLVANNSVPKLHPPSVLLRPNHPSVDSALRSANHLSKASAVNLKSGDNNSVNLPSVPKEALSSLASVPHKVPVLLHHVLELELLKCHKWDKWVDSEPLNSAVVPHRWEASAVLLKWADSVPLKWAANLKWEVSLSANPDGSKPV